MLRHAAVTKTSDLRKDEPDSVAGLSSGVKFNEDGVLDGRLGGEEAVEIVGVGHGQCLRCDVDRGSAVFSKIQNVSTISSLAPFIFKEQTSAANLVVLKSLRGSGDIATTR